MSSELSVEKEIQLLIEIIDAAVMHGGDMGGAYYSDWPYLEAAIGEWIAGRGLTEKYVPAEGEWLVKVDAVSMVEICGEDDKYCIEIPCNMIQGEQDIITSGQAGVPMKLMFCTPNGKGRCFDNPEERKYLYEVDYRRAEADNATIFYQKEGGGLVINSIPMCYLNKIDTQIDRIEHFLGEKNYFIQSVVASGIPFISLQKKDDKNARVTIYRDGRISSSGIIEEREELLFHQVFEMWQNN